MSRGQRCFFWGGNIYIYIYDNLQTIGFCCVQGDIQKYHQSVDLESTDCTLTWVWMPCCSGSFPCPSLAPQPVVLQDAIPTWICCWIWMEEDTTTNTGAKFDEHLFPICLVSVCNPLRAVQFSIQRRLRLKSWDAQWDIEDPRFVQRTQQH